MCYSSYTVPLAVVILTSSMHEHHDGQSITCFPLCTILKGQCNEIFCLVFFTEMYVHGLSLSPPERVRSLKKNRALHSRERVPFEVRLTFFKDRAQIFRQSLLSCD